MDIRSQGSDSLMRCKKLDEDKGKKGRERAKYSLAATCMTQCDHGSKLANSWFAKG